MIRHEVRMVVSFETEDEARRAAEEFRSWWAEMESRGRDYVLAGQLSVEVVEHEEGAAADPRGEGSTTAPG